MNLSSNGYLSKQNSDEFDSHQQAFQLCLRYVDAQTNYIILHIATQFKRSFLATSNNRELLQLNISMLLFAAGI